MIYCVAKVSHVLRKHGFPTCSSAETRLRLEVLGHYVNVSICFGIGRSWVRAPAAPYQRR